LQSDPSNTEARQQVDLTIQSIQAVKEAENANRNQDYAKTIELISTVIEVCEILLSTNKRLSIIRQSSMNEFNTNRTHPICIHSNCNQSISDIFFLNTHVKYQ
jgi:hypothetical protein